VVDTGTTYFAGAYFFVHKEDCRTEGLHHQHHHHHLRLMKNYQNATYTMYKIG